MHDITTTLLLNQHVSGLTNESDWPRQDLGMGTTRLSQCIQTLPPIGSGNETIVVCDACICVCL